MRRRAGMIGQDGMGAQQRQEVVFQTGEPVVQFQKFPVHASRTGSGSTIRQHDPACRQQAPCILAADPDPLRPRKEPSRHRHRPLRKHAGHGSGRDRGLPVRNQRRTGSSVTRSRPGEEHARLQARTERSWPSRPYWPCRPCRPCRHRSRRGPCSTTCAQQDGCRAVSPCFPACQGSDTRRAQGLCTLPRLGGQSCDKQCSLRPGRAGRHGLLQTRAPCLPGQ